MPTLILLGLGIFALLLVFGLLARYLRLWLQSYASSAGIGLFDLVAMSFKKVSPTVIVRSKIMAVQAGLGDASGITRQALEAHYLAGGRVPLVVQALIAANKAKIKELDWKLATAIDLAGRNVREAVQTSVYP
ncbi:MAG: flotillin-like FloA family protein, partial [Planctomycetia bacterium]